MSFAQARPVCTSLVVALSLAVSGWAAAAETARGYDFKSAAGGGLSAWNDAQRLQALVSADGVRLAVCNGAEAPLAIALRLHSLSRGGESRAPGAAELRAAGARAELRYESLGVTEQYANDARGVEQTFTFERRLGFGSEPLQLELELSSGPDVARIPVGDGVRFTSGGCADALELRDLLAWDANGVRLPAKLVADAERLKLVVADEAAVYPITVDPLATAPSVTLPGAPSLPVQSISTAGDLNGDGYSDLAVGFGTTVNVYLGSATGLHTLPDWTISGMGDLAVVTAAGDVNGDGFDDLLVGAAGGTGGVDGFAYLFFGAADLASHPAGSPATANWSVTTSGTPAATNSLFAAAVAAADLNGDGYSDIAIGAVLYAGGYGAVFVWAGGPSFGSSTPVSIATADWTASGDASNTFFGRSLGSAGDVNGDGFPDLAVGVLGHKDSFASTVGGVAIYFRGASFSSRPSGTVANADRLAEGTDSTDPIGKSVAGAGDVNGDGLADIVVSGDGHFNIFSGPSAGPLSPIWSVSVAPNNSPLFENPVATAGDVNGDGLADVLVGSFVDGKAYVYFGRLNNPPSTTANETRALMVSPSLAYHGWLATAGDVNGDGFSDVAIKSNFAEVSVSVYYGGGYPTATNSTTATYAGQAGAAYGTGMGAAGDINGDGYSDYVAGAPSFHDGEDNEGFFTPIYGGDCNPGCVNIPSPAAGVWEGNQLGAAQGWSVTGAGDVDGDGYGDVVVGAPLFDHVSPPTADVGRVQIYLGGATGLAASASITLEGQDGAGAQLGFEVAGAGDVNGDGRGDVIMAAPYANNGAISQAGKVYLYLGAATAAGINPIPAWTRSGTIAGQHLGIQLASAGDVNRDGYSDVIIGALNTGPSGEVAALVFTGQKNGLAASPVATLVGGEVGDDYGITVASAGDVNGDGYSDIAMGEPEWGGVSGRVRIFLGQALGVSSTPATTLPGPNGGGRFGSGIGGGGDVDGDGYGDLAVGEQWAFTGDYEGAVHIYLGGAAGLSTTEALEFKDTPRLAGNLGRDVSINLDVNGDGFSDVIASAFGADGGGRPGEGAVFVHLGGGGKGVARHTHMSRFTGGAPLALLGTLAASDDGNFGIQSLMRTAAGRTRVVIQVESKPLDQGFDGSGVTSGPSFLTAVPPFSGLFYGVCGSGIGCQWRFRLSSDNPFFPRTPWLSPPGNSPTEVDVRGMDDRDGDGISALADLCPQVADPSQSNADSDLLGDACDNCPSLANDDQADNDLDLVGDVCDSCQKIANPRVAAGFLTANPWATLTGGQRDDDHDGYGNKCDAKFPQAAGAAVGTNDLTQFRTAFNKARTVDTCGSSGTKPCAIFDLDEAAAAAIGTGDLNQFRLLFNKAPGPKCATCPLPCAAGTAGTCGVIP